jgi:hypothetical protein
MLSEIAVPGIPPPGWYLHPHRGRYEQVTLTSAYEQLSLLLLHFTTPSLPLIPNHLTVSS